MRTWKKALIASIALATASGCGLLREKEAPAPVAKTEAGLASCSYPEFDDLTDEKKASVPMIESAVDCLESQLDSGFDKVKGARPGELSVTEIRELKDHGIIKFDSLSDDEWKTIEGALSLFHPDGRPAISRARAKEIFAWLRRSAPLYIQSLNIVKREKHLDAKRKLDWSIASQILDRAEEFSRFISDSGQITLSQAYAAARAGQKRMQSKKAKGEEDALSLTEQLGTFWRLQGLLLPGVGSDSPELTGRALRELIEVGIAAARKTPKTYEWIMSEGLPQETPSNLAQEWTDAIAILKTYFSRSGFAEINADELRGILRKLDPQSSFPDLVPDLIRISQKLSPRDRRHTGLHVDGIMPLLDQLPLMAQDIVDSAGAFGPCKNAWRCEAKIRDIYQSHPVLKKVAVKGAFEYYGSTLGYPAGEETYPKTAPLDTYLNWQDAMGRLFERRLLAKIFDSFDNDHDGKIAYTGEKSKELADASDIAFTFLRFVSVQNSNAKKDDDGKPIQAVMTPITIKPSALYRLIGLIGDQWMLDGDRDGKLNADEFYSVIKTYQTIQELARYALSSGLNWEKMPAHIEESRRDYWNVEQFYSRWSFVQNFHTGLRTYVPRMMMLVDQLDPQVKISLFHGLVTVPDEPKTLYPVSYQYPWQPTQPVTLQQYASSSAALAPTAIFFLMERMMLRCDSNEDGQLNWNELDCAMPLLLEAGLQVASSELIDLDPGTHDGMKLILSTLNQPGFPLMIAKLVAINGSIRQFNFDSSVFDRVDQSVEASFADLADFVGSPNDASASAKQRAIWEAEARRRYGSCDLDHDGKISKSAELDCFADRVLDQVESLLTQLIAQDPNSQLDVVLKKYREIRQLPLLRLAPKIAILRDPNSFLETMPGAKSNPKKLFELLESAIRRSRDACQLPSC